MAPGTGKDKHVTSNTNPLYNDDDDEHQFPGGRTDGAVTEMIEAATAGMVGGAAEVRKAAMMDAEHEEALGESTRNGVFGAFCFLEVMANFDAGVLPVSIRHIMVRGCCCCCWPELPPLRLRQAARRRPALTCARPLRRTR